MSTKNLYHLSALAGVLSGLCIIIGKLLIPLPNRQIGEIIDFFSPLFALLFAVDCICVDAGNPVCSGVLLSLCFL